MVSLPHDPLNNLHITGFEPLPSPEEVRKAWPVTEASANLVAASRHTLQQMLKGHDRRLLVIVGPCSIHDPVAALDYAGKLAALSKELAGELVCVMRVYFEKPRTTIGWKGLINDPHLDGTHDITAGLLGARKLLLQLNELGLPCATEFLDPIVPQYIADLITWAGVGARTSESQIHREMASGLSMPVGFKNATDGSLQGAIDALIAAKHPHAFIGLADDGRPSVVRTRGNPDVHIVLRGGAQVTNYAAADVVAARNLLLDQGVELDPLARRILIDCSHGNSKKDYEEQPIVFKNVLAQCLANKHTGILGMMLESNLVAGKQNFKPGKPLVYGQSITDSCLSFTTTASLLTLAATSLGALA